MQNASHGTFKKFNAKNFKVGVVVAQFNADITEHLLKSARARLAAYRVLPKNIKIVSVAGSVEVPVVLKALAETGDYDCLVALGCVIRGETAHFEYVCKMVTEGVLRVALDYGLPVGFGVLTIESREQALARLGAGGAAVEAALQAAKSIAEIKG